MTITSPSRHRTSRRAAPARLDWRDAACVILLVVVFLALAATFLPQQSIWIDETTQLSGLAMGPGEVVTFLTGKHPPIGVPPDRNPPLSYWAGQCWSSIWGLTESTMRWFGVTCVAGAIAMLYLAARRFGRAPALVSAGFIALSPAVVVIAVEIRAYPLYLLLSAACFWTLLAIVDAPLHQTARARRTDRNIRRPALLTALLIAAIYTHFFGVMLAGAILTAWLAHCLLTRRSLKAPLLVALLIAIACCGLYPFINSASAVSGEPAPATSFIKDLLKFPYNHLTHPAMRLAGTPTLFNALTLALAAACVAIPVGIARALNNSAGRAVLIAMLAGICAVVLAAIAIKKFNPLASNYNLWFLPALAIVAGLAVSGAPGLFRKTGIGAAALLLGAFALGSIQLGRHGTAFAHGPQNQIFAIIDRYGPANVTFIQDSDSTGSVDFTMLFPLRYRYRQALQRYSVAPAAPAEALQVYDDNKRTQTPAGVWVDPTPLPVDLGQYVIIIRTQDMPASDLVAAIHNGPRPFGDGPACQHLLNSGTYHRVDSKFFLAPASADVDIFERN